MREYTQFKFQIKKKILEWALYVKHIQIFLFCIEGTRQYKWENRDCLYSMIYLNSCGKKMFTSSAISKTSQKYVEVKNMRDEF